MEGERAEGVSVLVLYSSKVARAPKKYEYMY